MNTPADTVALAQGYWKSPLEEFGLGVIGACRGPGRGRLGQVVVVVVMHLPFPGVISNNGHVLALEENAQGEEGLYRGQGTGGLMEVPKEGEGGVREGWDEEEL